MAPEVGLEPTTNRLTADRSTTELLRIFHSKSSAARRARMAPFVRRQIQDRASILRTSASTASGFAAKARGQINLELESGSSK